MTVVRKRDPLDQAIRNVKIATFLAVVATCLQVARLIILLTRR